MGKYGTNLEGFGAFEGGVNADNGAPLISTQSVGEKAQIFGPTSFREIRNGMANGDFSIPPVDPDSNISDSNPLPYWTFTDVNSSGAISCKIVADSAQASANTLRWTINSGTATTKSAKITRYVPMPSSRDQAYAVLPDIYAAAPGSAWDANANVKVEFSWAKADYTSTGSGGSVQIGGFTSTANRTTTGNTTANNIPSDAAFCLITITLLTIGMTSTVSTLDLYEVSLNIGSQTLVLAEQGTPASYAPSVIQSRNGDIQLLASPTITGVGETANGRVYVGGAISLYGSTLSTYDKGGSADTTTITTAGTYYALTNAEVSFTPQFVGQRWLLTLTGYASLNTTTVQYCFVRGNITDSSNTVLETLGFSRSDNFSSSGRGATVALTKVWVADTTSARKFKLYGTTQTTNGLTLSLAYTQMVAYPIG